MLAGAPRGNNGGTPAVICDGTSAGISSVPHEKLLVELRRPLGKTPAGIRSGNTSGTSCGSSSSAILSQPTREITGNVSI